MYLIDMLYTKYHMIKVLTLPHYPYWWRGAIFIAVLKEINVTTCNIPILIYLNR